MNKISDNSFTEISSLFIEEDKGVFTYKSGKQLYSFFNQYFQTVLFNSEMPHPSRRILVGNTLKEFDTTKLNMFFSKILSVKYMKTEFPELCIDEINKKVNEAKDKVNSILKTDDLIISNDDNEFRLEDIDYDLEKIGEGGFAEVFRIKSQNIVVKKLLVKFYSDVGITSRFKREFQITDGLKNIPGVINVYNYDADNFSYTMELAEYDLEKYIKNNQLCLSEKFTIISKILEIMNQVHKRNIIHRDLSPSNILFVSKQWKIADFGIGKDYSKNYSHVTDNTASFGRFQYCDPRQYQSLKEGDKFSDIFSLGRIINFVMTGDPLECSHEVSSISCKATTKEIELRYKNIDEMIKDFKNTNNTSSRNILNGRIDRNIETNKWGILEINYILNMKPDEFINKIQKHQYLRLTKSILQNHAYDDQSTNLLVKVLKFLEPYKEYTKLDVLGNICIFIVEEKCAFELKLIAINILNCIMIEKNRFSIISKVKEMLTKGIEPSLEDEIDKNNFDEVE